MDPVARPGPRPVTIAVMAKAPLPGRVKTRLCPPLTALQAARIAEACLRDTLRAMSAAQVARRVVVLEGPVNGWMPTDFDVVVQRAGGLADRLVGAEMDVGGPLLLIAMDTPQVTPALLDSAASALLDGTTDAVLGRCPDGGYWCIGVRRPDPRVFAGVPMSRPTTAGDQRARLDELGLVTVELPELRDVDEPGDLAPVADAAPHTEFAREVHWLARLGVA